MARVKKAGLIKKDPMKDAPKVALRFAIRGGSAVATGAVSNMAKSIIPKYHGPIALGLGLAAEMLIDNEEIVAAAQGVAIWGTIETAKEFVPDSVKEKMGLGSTDNDSNLVEIDSTPDWDELAQDLDFDEVEEEALEGVEEDMTDDELEEMFAEVDKLSIEESIL